MRDLPIRHDVIVLETGMPVAVVRARLDRFDMTADPVVVVRKQNIASYSFHRISAHQLSERLGGAEPDAVIADLFDFDAGNQVDVHELAEIDDTPPYGIVAMGRTIVGFAEGSFESAIGEATRSAGAAVMDPPDLASPIEPLTPVEPLAPVPPPPADRVLRSALQPRGVEPTTGPLEDTEPVAANGPAAPTPTDRFAAFPAIDAPVTVEPAVPFRVAVDLGPVAARHTSGTAVVVDHVTEEDQADDTLDFHVMVTGPFSVADNGSNTGIVSINRSTMESEPFVVDLIPMDPPESYDPHVGMWVARIVASFHYDGAFVGEAIREIRVNQMMARSTARESDRNPPAHTETTVAPLDDIPDLTITIRREGGAASGMYRVEFTSPMLPTPVDCGLISLDADAKSFAADLITEVDYTIANEVSDETLEAVGLILRDKMPDKVLTLLEHVWERTGAESVPEDRRRIPDVLLLTDDWSVPWELLSIQLDPSRPAFLGAQVNLGRWPLEHLDKLSAQPLDLEHLAVMVGYYEEARRVTKLERAEAEGTALEERYHARKVNADHTFLNQLLAGRIDDFEFAGLHFAGHGESNPEKGTYLMYSNGKPMSVLPFRAAKIAKEKDAFLFVNACQVGTANEMLGGYAGLAGLSIGAGFRAFVAPLWSVADDVAQTIALGLYAASTEGMAVSEYLRTVRENFFQTESAVAHTTYLAYCFYGHPRLRLAGPRTKGDET